MYMTSCDNFVIPDGASRPPLTNFDILPNSDVTNSILGNWYVVGINNQFYSIFFNTIKCFGWNITTSEVTNNTKSLLWDFSFCFLSSECNNINDLIPAGTTEFRQVEEGLASFRETQNNIERFPAQIVYSDNNEFANIIVLRSCNDPEITGVAGLRENVLILTRGTAVIDKKDLKNVNEYLYSIGIPLIQIEMIDTQDDTCPQKS